MDALIACYGSDEDSSSDSSSCDDTSSNHLTAHQLMPAPVDKMQTVAQPEPEFLLPPPPVDLLTPSNSLGAVDYLQTGQSSRVRNFPHVEGNYALHVFIPVVIPTAAKELTEFLKKVSYQMRDLHAVDVDIPLNKLWNDEKRLDQVFLGREFHISLGRTVPIRVHQIDSVVNMLKQKLRSQNTFWIDFNKWEVFVNDDGTRTFLSIEVTSGGLAEITRMIRAVDVVYKLHNLPEFYKDPRPHISLAWAVGDVSDSLRRALGESVKKDVNSRGPVARQLFTVKFSGVECKVGNKSYKIT